MAGLQIPLENEQITFTHQIASESIAASAGLNGHQIEPKCYTTHLPVTVEVEVEVGAAGNEEL